MLFKSLPICLLALIIDVPTSSATLVPRILQEAHHVVMRHTHSLAQDLRVAFGAVLVPRASTFDPNHVVYCKNSKQAVLDGGTSGPSNGTSPSPTSGTSKLAGTTSTRTSKGPGPTASVLASSWKLLQSYGSNFFDGWEFFTGSDPTNGIVTYIDENTARASGLLQVNPAGNAVMRVETTPSVPSTRQSIRITTEASYNGGLVLMDAVHMPTGCGTWPAFWSNGPNWPAGGEIDIVEGVHDYTNNQMTIHTDPSCTLATSSPSGLGITGSVVGGTDCAALTTGNQGCGIRAATNNTFGSGFNTNGGGVYGMKWDTTGVAVYFFPRGSIPEDISAGAPQPDSWGLAQARWPAASCDPFKFFNNHHAIFDTTLCGDWASGVWTDSGIPGQEQSCAQRTGFSTCEAFVRAQGASFANAYWEVTSVQIYQESQ